DAEAPVAVAHAAADEPEVDPEAPAWLTGAIAGAGAVVGAGALAVASLAGQEQPEPEAQAPTVATEPVADEPVASPAALESWLSQVEDANPVDPFADTAPRKPRAPVEPALVDTMPPVDAVPLTEVRA